MKKLLIMLLVVAVAGCAKTNTDIAKDLIQERLKATLPDYDKYESVNHGELGKAFLPYEETDLYVSNTKAIKAQGDSIAMYQARLASTPPLTSDSSAWYKQQVTQLEKNIQALRDSISGAKMAYVPQQLFKLTHSYKIKAGDGTETLTEDAYYFDTAVTRIVKVRPIK